MTTDTNKAIVRQFMQQVADGNIDGALELLSTDAVVHLAGAPGPLDRAGFEQFGRAFHAAFADELLMIEDQVAEGDKVVTRLVETATHNGTFQGLPPSGKRVRMTAIWIDRIADGRIAERWSEFDQFSMLQQLGGLAAPGTAARARGAR